MSMLQRWLVSDQPGSVGEARPLARSKRKGKPVDEAWKRGEHPPAHACSPVVAVQSLGGSAIIATQCASAQSLPAILALPENLQTAPRNWVNSTCRSSM